MSATTHSGGSAEEAALAPTTPRGGQLSGLWLVLLALIFVAAIVGSFAVVRGRISPTAVSASTQAASAPATPLVARSTAVAAPAEASSTGNGTQATPSADQAAAAYLQQQSHEQDFCSCNTGQPPSSP